MSATLTWYHTGLGTKTGTAIGNCFADLETLIDSKAADGNFSWAKASANVGSSPYYIVLKPKSGAAGRILLLAYTSGPAANNAAIFNATPAGSCVYCTYFPSGNVDTPSNLAAASGTILGNDTGVIRCILNNFTIANIYGANVQPFYFDSAEAVVFGFQSPSGTNCLMTGAGYLVVDANDDAYPAVIRCSSSVGSWGTQNSNPLPWSSTAVGTSSATTAVMTNYGAAHSPFFVGFVPSGTWATSAVGATDILSDTTISRAWFVPTPLLGQTKGQGFVLKLRQIAFGTGTLNAFAEYATTGPITAARQFNAATAGGNGFPWFTNFKL